MVNNGELQAILDKIKELDQEEKEPKSQKKKKKAKKNVVLFFSFDIVNSTLYKTINYYGWAQVLNLLFKRLREEVRNNLEGSEMWRVLGDEAIFIIKIRDEEHLQVCVRKIFGIMISTIYALKKGEFFNHNNNLMKLQNILSLKVATWIAAVNNIGDVDDKDILQEDIDNIFECYTSQEGNKIFEFLGNDIDTGFRIATQTQEGRMVLSYELAYLICQRTGCLSNLHIVTYKKLKGVWKNKLYPIIWYHDPGAYLDVYKKEVQLEESFTFDACEESELIKEYFYNRDVNKKDKIIYNDKMYIDPFYALNKILQDRELEEKINHLQQLIKNQTYDQTKYIDMELMQIHCVAVCFKKEENKIKILVAKRGEERKKHKEEWEFGCAKAVIDKSIAERIKEEYKQDFNIDIEPVLDKTREIQEPIPIALYQIEHTNDIDNPIKKDKGIITLAKIIGNYELDTFQSTKKHDKVEWITEEDMPNINEKFKKTVPDFKQTLEKAFEMIKNLEKEE